MRWTSRSSQTKVGGCTRRVPGFRFGLPNHRCDPGCTTTTFPAIKKPAMFDCLGLCWDTSSNQYTAVRVARRLLHKLFLNSCHLINVHLCQTFLLHEHHRGIAWAECDAHNLRQIYSQSLPCNFSLRVRRCTFGAKRWSISFTEKGHVDLKARRHNFETLSHQQATSQTPADVQIDCCYYHAIAFSTATGDIIIVACAPV